MSDKDLGTMLGVGELRMMRRIGDAKDGPDGERYELLVTTTGEPCVRSYLSGRKFLLDWNSIITLAVRSGVDDRDTTSSLRSL